VSPLQRARRFVIPDTVLDPTLDALVAAGRNGHEAFAVWGAVVSHDGTEVAFRSCTVPRQTPHVTSHGLLVEVSGQALFEVNRALFQRGEILAGQVHTHPTDAYHSDTDDHFPLVTLAGALSVVVPDFARGWRDDMRRWAWYRLTGQGTWAELDRGDRVVLDRSR